MYQILKVTCTFHKPRFHIAPSGLNRPRTSLSWIAFYLHISNQTGRKRRFYLVTFALQFTQKFLASVSETLNSPIFSLHHFIIHNTANSSNSHSCIRWWHYRWASFKHWLRFPMLHGHIQNSLNFNNIFKAHIFTPQNKSSFYSARRLIDSMQRQYLSYFSVRLYLAIV